MELVLSVPSFEDVGDGSLGQACTRNVSYAPRNGTNYA